MSKIDFSKLNITVDDTPIDEVLKDEPDFDDSGYSEDNPIQVRYKGKDEENRCVKLEILS